MKINLLLERIIEKLVVDGKINLYGIGTFYLKPARKGEFKTKHGRGTTSYNWRVVFRSSHLFKEKVNQAINEKR